MDQGVVVAIIAGICGIVGAGIGAWATIAAARVKAQHPDVIRSGGPANIGQTMIGGPGFQPYPTRQQRIPTGRWLISWLIFLLISLPSLVLAILCDIKYRHFNPDAAIVFVVIFIVSFLIVAALRRG
jgi:hypothetical protein